MKTGAKLLWGHNPREKDDTFVKLQQKGQTLANQPSS